MSSAGEHACPLNGDLKLERIEFCWMGLVLDHPLKAIRILAGRRATETCSMSKPVVEVQVRGLAATGGGCAVFLGNEEKAFVIFVDQSVGAAIAMFKQGTQKERPLTHDLLANILRALGAKIERVIVNDLKARHLFCETCLKCRERTETEEDHRDRCAAQRLYRDGDSANRADLRKP